MSAAPANDHVATGWTGGHNPWSIAVVVTLATFMEILDTSIANIALPQIAGNLGVSRSESTWVLTSYLAANAVVVPISGWLSNRLGRKRYYMACVAAFSGTSLLCGMAPTIETLVLCRVLQGIAGGGLVPSEQAILVDTFPAAKRGMAMAVYGMTAVLAPALGPTIGGFVTDHLSWRWIFFINIPIGVLSLFLTSRVLSDPPHVVRARGQAPRIDWIGLVLITAGFGCLELVFEKGQEQGWFDSRFITVCTIVAAVSLVSFAIREWDHPNPIVDLKLLTRRNFAVANLLMVALAFTSFGVTVLLPQYLQAVMGYTAHDAGMVLSPGGLLIFALLPIAGRLVSKVDPRALVCGGFLVVGASVLFTVRALTPAMDFSTAVQLRLLQCAGFAFLFVPTQMIAYAGMPPQKNNQAASMINLSRNFGADIGIAFLVTLIYRHRQMHQAHLVAHATTFEAPFRAALARAAQLLGDPVGAPLGPANRALALVYDDIVKQAMELAYLDGLMGLAAVAGLTAVIVWLARSPRAVAAQAAR